MNLGVVAGSVAVAGVLVIPAVLVRERARVLHTPEGNPYVRCHIRIGWWKTVSIQEGRMELRDGAIRLTRYGRRRLLMDPIPVADLVRVERDGGPNGVRVLAEGRDQIRIWCGRRAVAVAFFAEAGVTVTDGR